VLDSGTEETGAPYLVMELLNGRSFEDELTERGSIPYEEALKVVLPIARALSVAHAHGVIHRDLKPSNIFLCRGADGTVTPKLLDFGIAKSDANDFETQTGLVVGSPSYMAPEQARDGECGAYTDIWGIAAVLYRAVTGKPPHAAESVHEMLALRVREPASPLVAPGVKKSVCAVVDRALERDPERRHRTMQAFVGALEGASTPDGRSSHDETHELPARKLEMPSSAPEPSLARSSEASSLNGRVRPVAFATATAVMLLVVVEFIRHTEGAATEPRAFAGQSPTATTDPNPGSSPTSPLRKQVEARSVLDELPPSAPRSATAAPPLNRVQNEAAASGHREGPRAPASVPEATNPPQNPRRLRVDSTKPVSAPEYERRTGLPLATEW
jgi:serine/threonine protein kinase